jgi:hypothetical protein
MRGNAYKSSKKYNINEVKKMEQYKECEKYIFLVNNTVVAIEAADKTKAIEIFKDQFNRLYDMDWEIKRLVTEININGEFKRY